MFLKYVIWSSFNSCSGQPRYFRLYSARFLRKPIRLASTTPLTSDLKMRSELFLDLLQKWGKKINLTSVSEREELFRFHILEAFWAAQIFSKELTSFTDIGSGAGFPGLAIHIFNPRAAVTLIEPNLKRVMFLKTVISDLSLDTQIFHGKAEDFSDWKRFIPFLI